MSDNPHIHPSTPDPMHWAPNRRQFLLGAAGGVALALPGGARARGAPRIARRGPDWDQLERTLKGTLLRPGAEGYADAIKIRNVRYAATRPAGVALVANAKDVATAIAWARDNQVEMVSRSGGHSYAGYCTTPGLVINLKGMTSVTVDPADGNMTTTGAATNQGVADAGKLVGRAIPGGQCPGVGVAGFVLGGGLGFSMREYGLGIDSLLSTEIVTADGTLRTVSAETDEGGPGLFWALCGGGGGNFGINTSFTFRTFVVPERVTIFSLKWGGDDSVRAFLAFQELLPNAPDALGAIAHFGTEAGPSGTIRPYLRVFGQVAEPKQAVHKVLGPLYGTMPRETLVEEKTFWEAKGYLAGTPSAPQPFAERSRFYAKPLPEEAVAALVDALARAPVQGPNLEASSSFFAWGGAVSRVAPNATAFVHRNDLWLQAINCGWGADTGAGMDRLLAWQDKIYDAMGAYSTDRAYQNFTDPLLKDPLRAYYADNLPCLVDIKKRVDPHNVFHFPQSIPA